MRVFTENLFTKDQRLLQWQEYLFICSVICSYPIQQITGESRGFAFVTFATIDEARKWLEMKQVEMLGDT